MQFNKDPCLAVAMPSNIVNINFKTPFVDILM